MDTNLLSQENFETLITWLQDDNAPMPEFAESFMTSLDALYMSRSGQRIKRSAGTRLSLAAILENQERQREQSRRTLDEIEAGGEPAEETAVPLQEQEAKPVTPAPRIGDEALPLRNDDGFIEAQLDSLTVAKAIGWHYSRLSREITQGRQMTMSFLQLTLFTIYGTVLADRATRLTAEHPQMWQYGPVFPNVYRKYEADRDSKEAAAAAIRGKDPSLDEFIQRTVRFHAERKISETTRLHTSITSPWGRCRKEHPDAWGTTMDDKTTAIWFRQYIDRFNARTAS